MSTVEELELLLADAVADVAPPPDLARSVLRRAAVPTQMPPSRFASERLASGRVLSGLAAAFVAGVCTVGVVTGSGGASGQAVASALAVQVAGVNGVDCARLAELVAWEPTDAAVEARSPQVQAAAVLAAEGVAARYPSAVPRVATRAGGAVDVAFVEADGSGGSGVARAALRFEGDDAAGWRLVAVVHC